MDDLKGKEEHPRKAFAEKLEKGLTDWCGCDGTPELTAGKIIFLVILVIIITLPLWHVVIYGPAYKSDGENSTTAGQTSFNGLTDCPFHRSWIAVVGRRGLPYLQTEACQITVVQEAVQKAQFSHNCCDHGRQKLQDNQPPNPETLKSLDFSDSDTNHSDDVSDWVTNADDNPNPGPKPSPPDHDYPPPTSWSVAKPDGHTDYAPVGPHSSPDHHDYPPPTSIV